MGGYKVDVVNSGQKALDAISGRHSYDLILMDVQMPEMDGFDTTIAIRKQEKLKGGHIPIVALTAHAMKGDQERCLQAGMDGYVSKPIHATQLLTAIESAVKSSDLQPRDPAHARDRRRRFARRLVKGDDHRL